MTQRGLGVSYSQPRKAAWLSATAFVNCLWPRQPRACCWDVLEAWKKFEDMRLGINTSNKMGIQQTYNGHFQWSLDFHGLFKRIGAHRGILLAKNLNIHGSDSHPNHMHSTKRRCIFSSPQQDPPNPSWISRTPRNNTIFA